MSTQKRAARAPWPWACSASHASLARSPRLPGQPRNTPSTRCFRCAAIASQANSILCQDPGPCPGVPGVDHPVKPITVPCGVAVDTHGDTYSRQPRGWERQRHRRANPDLRRAGGEYLTEIADEHRPCDLAVDGEGNLYVNETNPLRSIRLSARLLSSPARSRYGIHALGLARKLRILSRQSQLDCGGSPPMTIS